MGYDFFFKKDGPKGSIGATSRLIPLLREAMIKTGAAHRGDDPQATQTPGFAATSESVDLKKFLSNDGWHVSAEEAKFIASRLEQGLSEGLIGEIVAKHIDRGRKAGLSDFFVFDNPDEALICIREFVDFNLRAVEYDGYFVY